MIEDLDDSRRQQKLHPKREGVRGTSVNGIVIQQRQLVGQQTEDLRMSL